MLINNYCFLNYLRIAARLNVFIKYNGHWDHASRYVGCEMKGILVPTNTTYIGLIDLVRNVLEIQPQGKSLYLRYVVEHGKTPVKISSDYDVTFYMACKKNKKKKQEKQTNLLTKVL